MKPIIIHLEDLASAPLPRAAEWEHLARQREMIRNSLRDLRYQGLFVTGDAGVIIPSHLAPFARSIYSS